MRKKESLECSRGVCCAEPSVQAQGGRVLWMGMIEGACGVHFIHYTVYHTSISSASWLEPIGFFCFFVFCYWHHWPRCILHKIPIFKKRHFCSVVFFVFLFFVHFVKIHRDNRDRKAIEVTLNKSKQVHSAHCTKGCCGSNRY
jgi:hypothetical protein